MAPSQAPLQEEEGARLARASLARKARIMQKDGIVKSGTQRLIERELYVLAHLHREREDTENTAEPGTLDKLMRRHLAERLYDCRWR